MIISINVDESIVEKIKAITKLTKSSRSQLIDIMLKNEVFRLLREDGTIDLEEYGKIVASACMKG